MFISSRLANVRLPVGLVKQVRGARRGRTVIRVQRQSVRAIAFPFPKLRPRNSARPFAANVRGLYVVRWGTMVAGSGLLRIPDSRARALRGLPRHCRAASGNACGGREIRPRSRWGCQSRWLKPSDAFRHRRYARPREPAAAFDFSCTSPRLAIRTAGRSGNSTIGFSSPPIALT